MEVYFFFLIYIYFDLIFFIIFLNFLKMNFERKLI